MPAKEIALDVAAFLDSEQARALLDGGAPRAEAARRVVEAFLSVCYDELGKHPRLLDGQDMHGALGHLLPAHFGRRDPAAEHAPEILRAYLEHLEASQTVPEAFELRSSFEATIGEFQETVRTGENAHGHHHAARVDPFVHGAPKLGRNDPCSCGSGKKYKKCHGRGA
jgi:hypothetical protein